MTSIRIGSLCLYMTGNEIIKFIENSYELKPESLIMNELKWRYLVRSGIRGKNILLLGPTGSGKTLAAQSLVKALKREDRFFYINMGATQDPRTALIGNTHFSKSDGTFFNESAFVKAIKTPNSVILLDEISRGHPDAWNILLSVLDVLQRYLRLDEAEGSEVVKVAEGVTFIATANVGNEYTATRVMDRALLDRFSVKIEVDVLSAEQERDLIQLLVPNANEKMMKIITEVAQQSRQMVDGSKITKAISTRAVVEMAELSADGFTLKEISEMVIYPDYPTEGGVDSERTFIKQLIQKYIS